jgi:hypothetical protein
MAGLAGVLVPATTAAGADPGGVRKHIYPLVDATRHTTGSLGLPRAISIGGGAGPLLYGGGPIQKSPKVYLTFWGWHGSDPTGEAAILQNFFNGVGGSSWANIQTQYRENARGNITNPAGQLKGVWFDDSSTPLAVILDSQVAAEAVKAEQHFGFDPDADYMVATPTGTGTAGFKVQYCAWHSITSDGGKQVAYTNLPYITDAGTSCGQNYVNGGSAGTSDGVTIVGGHEYAEAVTDPDVSTGWIDASGQENGDKCAWNGKGGTGGAQNISISTGSFPVQGLWSNASGLLGGCVVRYP